MEFEFDPDKAAENLKKHGVPFSDAEGVFVDPLAVHRPDPDAEGEERFIAVGLGSAGQLLVAVYTLRGEKIRSISVRRATKQEVKDYES
jgi:uncharacterized DUF497 family protein